MGVEPVIDARGLTKRYGGVTTVDGLDLTVPAGEVFSLLGPNGAGKTTTVEMLCGVRPRSAGEVSVVGEDPATYSRTFRDRVGVVPQTTGAFDELGLRELVGHFARAYSSPLPIDEVVAAVGLTEKANSLCRTLSGGQRRRVDVALALVGDPDLVFLDEPTTGLDPEVRRQFWDVVRATAARGKTIVLTTHYLDEAETLADRVGVMIGGRLIAVGAPEEIGGRQHAAAQVRFERTGRLAAGHLPILPAGASVRHDGAVTIIDTSEPTAVVRALIDWAAAQQSGAVTELPGLTVLRPTLEDVYLKMISEYELSGLGPGQEAPAS